MAPVTRLTRILTGGGGLQHGPGGHDRIPTSACILNRRTSLRATEVAKDSTSTQHAFDRLVEIMRILRGPDGCPWDREQDLRSLRRYVLEEAFEVVQTIDDGDLEALPAELGDLLLQVVFLSQMAAEEGHFDVKTVIEAITDKLVRRHPHVFEDQQVETASEVLQRWETIKRDERGGGSVLDDIPTTFPALARAEKLGRRAAIVGFDWPAPAAVLDKVREELDEVSEAIEKAEQRDVRRCPEVEAEIGDLLFAIANLSRQLGLSPEVALLHANDKFERRFRAIEPEIAAGNATDVEAMDALWDDVKRRERSS